MNASNDRASALEQIKSLLRRAEDDPDAADEARRIAGQEGIPLSELASAAPKTHPWIMTVRLTNTTNRDLNLEYWSHFVVGIQEWAVKVGAGKSGDASANICKVSSASLLVRDLTNNKVLREDYDYVLGALRNDYSATGSDDSITVSLSFNKP